MDQTTNSAGRIALILHTTIARKVVALSKVTETKDLGPTNITRLLLLDAINIGITRVTKLAPVANVTQQAAGKMLREMASHGLIAIATEEEDKRAKNILLTDKGSEILSLWNERAEAIHA